MGRPHPARGDHRGARQPRARRQGPLRRLLQLLRLARDEGARRRRPRPPPALRQPADPLHAAGARGRIRAGADRADQGSASWCGARSPAACFPASSPAARKDPPAAATSPASGTSRRSTTRTSCSTSSTCRRHRPGPRRLRRPRRHRLAAGPARGHLRDHRRTHIGAVRRQPCRRRPEAGDDDLARLDAASRPNLIYPYWHQAWTAADRLGPADLSLIGKYLPTA